MRARSLPRAESREPRAAFTLMEVLVALTLLGFAISAGIGVANQNTHAVRLAQRREGLTSAAGELLARASVWSREELHSRVGRSEVRGLILDVAQPTPSLFTLSVTDSIGRLPLLATTFYIRDSSDAAAR